MASTVETNIMGIFKRNHKIECSVCINVFGENSKMSDSFINKKCLINPKIHQPCESTVKIITVINRVSVLLQQGNSFNYVVAAIQNCFQ